MNQPATASFAEFSRIARVKKTYVTQLRKAGRLVLTDDGKAVRVPESLALIESTRDPAKVGVAARHAAARAVATPPPPATAADVAGDEPPASYSPHSERRAKALADKEEALARKAERDEQLELGRLLDAAEVDAAIAAAGTHLRTTLEALPYDLSPELAAITDEAQLRAKLTEYVEAALAELSRQFAALAKRVPA